MTAIFNCIIDPFHVLKSPAIYGFNKEKPDLKTNERISKLFSVKINDFDTLFIGSSRVDFALDPEYYYKLTNKKAFNLGIGGSNISESKIILEKIIKSHPNLKTVVLEVDFFGFNKFNKIDSNESINSFISLNDIFKLFISYDSIQKSINTINYNFKNPNEYIFDKNGLRIKSPKHNSYNLAMAEVQGYIKKNKFYTSSPERLRALQEIVDLCKKNNIKLIVIVSPINFAQVHVINILNTFDDYIKWRNEISQITSFYDFSLGNYVTKEQLKRKMLYYFDSHHYTIIVGNKILDRVFNNLNSSLPINFGAIITKNNVNKYNKELYSDYKDWVNKNQEVVKKINAFKDYN
ncbi:MAG: hypothetical protein A2X64_07555 [Ignavibacteria bacterium GWF2_33_9]|nr:MAG: hypothetical protein A2X64_07555 [Ignavibacteria bacterium GWF2_33_9]